MIKIANTTMLKTGKEQQERKVTILNLYFVDYAFIY